MTIDNLLRHEQPATGVARLVLNRPDSKNALSRALRLALIERLSEFAADDSIQAVILTAVGDAFCAGFDLKELSQGDSKAIFAEAGNYHRCVYRFPKPLIAAINGPALAGGMDLALMCDFRLGTTSATFGQPQIRFGIPAAFDLIASVCDEGTARMLCLTGALMQSETALAQGIISARFEDNVRLQEEALDCARAIAESGVGTASKSSFIARQPALFEN